MNRLQPSIVILSIIAASVLSAQEVRLVSVSVKAPVPPEAESVAFGNFPDKNVEVEAGFVVLPGEGKSIVEAPEKKARVTEVVDAGNGQPMKLKAKFGNFPRLADGGKALWQTIEFDAPTDAPSRRLKLSGTIQAKISSGVTVEKVENFKLENGKSVTAGKLELKIGDVKTDDGDTELSFGAKEPLSSIKDIRFLGADGKALTADRRGTSRMSMLGSFSETWNFEIKGEVKDVSLEVEFFKDIETVELPFDFELPAGM